ncbi:MAG: hypothetical protein JXB10_01420 [Pirellulales bacterium]|nr:hypothetical protein [Pirellulales bacterium]
MALERILKAETPEHILKRLAGQRSLQEGFRDPPGEELTRAQALGTWDSFFGDYGACRHRRMDDFHRELLRSAMAADHKAATDYLIRLAHANGIDGTALHHAGELCRLLAKRPELRDPDAENHLWPACLGKHRYDLPQAQQEAIEAGERVIQQLRLKLYATAEVADSKEHDDLQPLSEREQQVADLIRKKGPMIGKEICNTTGIDQSTLTSQIVPNLKKHGLKNRRSVGYYF